ncbi:unnamed protein product [Rotaria sp. Silwood1]|nr:unnamed protein product [Rotaria sp. Silwood1]
MPGSMCFVMFVAKVAVNGNMACCKISTPIFFSNYPTLIEVDTAADFAGLSDLAALTGGIFINGKINFIDTPIITQSGNQFTCIASCIPIMYIWNTYDCSGNLISIDTTLTNTFISPLATGTCFSVVCAARYGNGNTIASHITSNILPLKLLSFTTQKESNTVLLNWQTAKEINVSHFNIQHSVNGKDYTIIGKVNAEIVDKDGSKQYSVIRNVELGISNTGVKVYPNPAKDIVTIECAGAKELLVVDYLGRTVFQSTVDRQLLTVNTKQFTKGVYVVKVVMKNGEVKTDKLVVE